MAVRMFSPKTAQVIPRTPLRLHPERMIPIGPGAILETDELQVLVCRESSGMFAVEPMNETIAMRAYKLVGKKEVVASSSLIAPRRGLLDIVSELHYQ